MSLTAALVGALLASLWQVALLGVAFALFRASVRAPQVRYVGALVTLALQLAWPGWTLSGLLALPLSWAAPSTVATSGRFDWVPLVWSLGATAMLVRTLGGLWVVRGWVTQSELPGAEVLARLEALRARLEVRAVRWGLSARLQVPLTVGFVRPVVLLPLSLLTAVPGSDLELLAAHELMHVHRWDYLVNLAQAVVEAALFFHPAMWWVSRCAREEREYCCDDAVVARLGAARPYARALLSLEQSLSLVAVAVPSTGGQFMSRIRRLLDTRRTSSSLPFALPLLGLTAVVLTLGACAAKNLKGDQVITAPPTLVPALKSFCADVKADASRPEVAGADPLDQMTMVVGDLSEKNPQLEAFLNELAKSPAPQRRDTLKRSISAAIGSEWQCPEFDALWDGKPLPKG